MKMRLKALNKPIGAESENAENEDNGLALHIPTETGVVHILLEDIICLEADNNYTIFHRRESQPLILRGFLADYERMLPSSSSSDFMRVHRSAVVNMSAIVRVERNHSRKGLLLTLQGGREVKVSREKTQLFLKRYYGNIVVTHDGSQLVIELRGVLAQADRRAGGGGGRKKISRHRKEKTFAFPKNGRKQTQGKH
jgi:hypothetical protein